MSADSVAKQKSMAFAKRIVKLYQHLTTEKKEFVMSEAVYGSSRKDFTAKLYIALKECAETLYWLELLHECEYIATPMYVSLHDDCEELRKILSSSTKTLG